MSSARRLRFGFSPCPNDTFAFWAAVHGEVSGAPEVEPVMADIEALNERAVGGADPLEVTKLSLPALARCVDDYAVLASGAALGFGCGPLVVARAPDAGLEQLPQLRVAVPGVHTTAYLLMSSLLPAPAEAVVAEREPALVDHQPGVAVAARDGRHHLVEPHRHGLCGCWQQARHQQVGGRVDPRDGDA